MSGVVEAASVRVEAVLGEKSGVPVWAARSRTYICGYEGNAEPAQQCAF